jgi:hypothetical protein
MSQAIRAAIGAHVQHRMLFIICIANPIYRMISPSTMRVDPSIGSFDISKKSAGLSRGGPSRQRERFAL